ncbi:MAG: hypothetical protein HXY24_08035 [Rubrivivax sp.]|nr:hypothetical protein [Rubrivivax sp.]
MDIASPRRHTLGDLLRRSPQLLGSCFRDDERTAAAFEGGWFHAGDLATIDDEAAVLARCGEHLATFRAPERVVFVDALTENPGGKLPERAGRLHHQQPFAAG